MGRSHRFSRYSSQLTFEVFEICVGSRPQIHVDRRFARNGVHRNAAAENAKVERAAGTVNVASTKTVDYCRHRVHGIRPAKVSPTVTAGPVHANAKSPASQR